VAVCFSHENTVLVRSRQLPVIRSPPPPSAAKAAHHSIMTPA
jgi:hypothetical protein